jgi:fatty acid desaturase
LLTCYFFGYHLEHHQYPTLPWWRLYQKKWMAKSLTRFNNILKTIR